MAHDLRSLGRSALVLAHVLAAVAAAVVVVAFYLRPEAFAIYDEASGVAQVSLRGSTAFDAAFGAAAVLLVLDALYVLYLRRPKPPLRYLASHGPYGVVKVARDALEAGLRAAGERLEVVTRLRVMVEAGGLKRVVVKAYFQSPEAVPIQTAFHDLRRALDARFREMVQVADGVKTDFEIEFVGFAGKLARVPDPSPEEEMATFTGPLYPIDEEPSAEVGGGR